MRKARVFAGAMVLAASSLLWAAPSANATTCYIGDPGPEDVICLVYSVTGPICGPTEKWGLCN